MPICSQSFYWIYLSNIKKLECFGFFAMANGIPLLKNSVSFFRPNLLLVSLFAVNDVEFCFRQLAGRGMKEAMIVVQSEMKKRKLR